MPIYARTSGGVYKAVSRILTADGSEIGKVVDSTGRIIYEASRLITVTGVPPISFTKSIGKPLVSWDLLGNGSQSGTPSPDNIIMPDFCGKLVGTDWTIPITCAGQTVPVYLGQTQAVRRVKKLVLDGTESWSRNDPNMYIRPSDILKNSEIVCTHYKDYNDYTVNLSVTTNRGTKASIWFNDSRFVTTEQWKRYIAAQYAAGTPVTVWYVLNTPETAIVNEPLCKIGDYADELHSTDAGVTIPTAKGNNTLTVDTDLPPSSMTVVYRGRQ